MLEKKTLLGIGITSVSRNKVLEYIIKGLENGGKKYFIVTPNPEILVLADKVSKYKSILNKADIALPDGIGVLIAGKILKLGLAERITGVEVLEDLCMLVAEKPITVGFLGGRHGVAEKTAECLQNRYPNLSVIFVGEEWPAAKTPFNNRFKIYDLRFKNKNGKIINHKSYFINHPSIDILFVAFGAPKQEMWISENLDKLPVRVAIGVGGAFDYISGRVPRAPLILRKIGIEWLFRLLVQPWRIKRQIRLLEFMFLVLKEKFGTSLDKTGNS